MDRTNLRDENDGSSSSQWQNYCSEAHRLISTTYRMIQIWLAYYFVCQLLQLWSTIHRWKQWLWSVWRTHSTADAVSTVPSMLNLILCLFTIPDHQLHHNADDHNADDANFNNSNEKLWLWLKMAMRNENAPVSTMKGLTSIRWSLFPGWVCNVTKYQLVDVSLNMIQGVFLTGTPPKSFKYKKVNLGRCI